ncbi:MAG: class III extradiol ring-cleavage dioxygenase, partial [Ignavibacteriota bacterium]
PGHHYSLAGELSELRKRRVLILGSGNIVHNLGMVNFQMQDGFDWAQEFDSKITKAIESRDDRTIIEYDKMGNSARLAVPTNDHFLPLLYTLGAATGSEDVTFFNAKNIAGSISMRSLIIA